MKEMPEEEPEQDTSSVDEETQNRIFRFARKLMDRKDLSADTRELLHSVVVTSDKAKNEAMRLIAREVRNYLDEMHLEEMIHQVLKSYSIEVSIRLNPLPEGSSSASEEEPETASEAGQMKETQEIDSPEEEAG